jgi:hypothetical protein
MTDHEKIYLEPSPGADEDYGRQWCQHNVWDEATEYVRADLCGYDKERDNLQAELLAILKECADFIQPFNRAEDLLDRVDGVIAKAEKTA